LVFRSTTQPTTHYYGTTTTTFARSEQGGTWPARQPLSGPRALRGSAVWWPALIDCQSEERVVLRRERSDTELSLVSRPNRIFKCKSSWSWLLRLVDRQIEMRMSCWQWLTALWAALAAVDAHLDLFMNETETKRLLGM